MQCNLDLDRCIEKVKQCEYLAEDELKQLCDFVSAGAEVPPRRQPSKLNTSKPSLLPSLPKTMRSTIPFTNLAANGERKHAPIHRCMAYARPEGLCSTLHLHFPTSSCLQSLLYPCLLALVPGMHVNLPCGRPAGERNPSGGVKCAAGV